jgi:hypothetical protein
MAGHLGALAPINGERFRTLVSLEAIEAGEMTVTMR